jgi:hypothetical protein
LSVVRDAPCCTPAPPVDTVEPARPGRTVPLMTLRPLTTPRVAAHGRALPEVLSYASYAHGCSGCAGGRKVREYPHSTPRVPYVLHHASYAHCCSGGVVSVRAGRAAPCSPHHASSITAAQRPTAAAQCYRVHPVEPRPLPRRIRGNPYRGVYAVTLTAADTRYVGDAAQVRLACCVPLALAPVAHRDRRDDCARWRVRALLQRCRVSLTPRAINTTEITSCRMGYHATSSVLPRAAQRRPTGAAAVEGLLYSCGWCHVGLWAVGRHGCCAGTLQCRPCFASSTRERYIRPSGTSTCPVPSTSSRRIKTGFANTIIHSQSRPAAPPSQPPTPHSACATPNAPGALSQSYSVRHGSVSCC